MPKNLDDTEVGNIEHISITNGMGVQRNIIKTTCKCIWTSKEMVVLGYGQAKKWWSGSLLYKNSSGKVKEVVYYFKQST